MKMTNRVFKLPDIGEGVVEGDGEGVGKGDEDGGGHGGAG